MAPTGSPQEKSWQDVLSDFKTDFFAGKTPDFTKPNQERDDYISQIAKNINLGNVKKEHLENIEIKTHTRIIQKAMKTDNFNLKIQEFVKGKDLLFQGLLKDDPEDLAMQEFCSKLTADNKTLKLEHNTYLSQEQIEQLLGRFTKEERAQVKELDLTGSEQLENLSFLTLFPNLKTLTLNDSKSLELLKGLESVKDTLEHLNLTGCSKLKNLDNVEFCTKIKSIKASNCTGLQHIGLRLRGETGLGQDPRKLDPKNQKLPHLKELDLSSCNSLRNASVDIIKALPQLEVLKLAHLPWIKGISWLKNFTALKELDLSSTGIKDASVLNSLQNNLKKINLENCRYLTTTPT